ncbi:hypothetical protein STCU_06214 [Strigomonas culicis]|uniref:Clathrin light chain n=1 Tax=Strigomonas culicis TaxID=28005 RepID=S9UBI4_9TRYP|nr:hypothetical protein STCU_06214 [Strigomonas culicis]|eukprot:EPY26313.1 hypothetical protein STCU_06214 [Strigomonas culicis]
MDDWSQPAAPASPKKDPIFDEKEPSAKSVSHDDFFGETSPTVGQPSAPAAAKPNHAPDPSAREAINRQIAKRTADIDAATKEKEANILAAAKTYLEAQKTKREKEVHTAKSTHQKEQQDDAKKIDSYKKSGAVWNSVGMLVDLKKPNPHSKNTERMRSLLTKLNEEKIKS